MAIIITSGTKFFNFDFGVLANQTINGYIFPFKTKRQKISVEKVELREFWIEYYVVGNPSPFLISHQNNSHGAIPITSVNGVVPTSLSHLFDLIDSILEN
ncbi:MAG: hypothetical protein HYU67_04685 [Flavobacteriia bacterium]|nr:hypothetical protein [Flavobacteriia bacterium]